MNVKLKAHIKWAEDEIRDIDIMAYCARVSNPSNQENDATAANLLQYCAEHKHWSVFEMSGVVFEINTTRDIARQILRHRSFHFQEFSQRYSDPSEIGSTIREARLQDASNRQNSVTTDDQELMDTWYAKQAQIIHECGLAYKWAIENGIAKEQARSVLPEGNTNSRMYMNGTMRDWIMYCLVRMGPDTQKEHRDIATEIFQQLRAMYPKLMKKILKANIQECIQERIYIETTRYDLEDDLLSNNLSLKKMKKIERKLKRIDKRIGFLWERQDMLEGVLK